MFNEREKKLIRMALDPGAIGGEIHNASIMLVTSLRARGVMADDVLGVVPQPEQRARRYIFPDWGKHAGKPFDQIPKDYLHWILRKWFGNLDVEGRLQWEWLHNEIVEYLQ